MRNMNAPIATIRLSVLAAIAVLMGATTPISAVVPVNSGAPAPSAPSARLAVNQDGDSTISGMFDGSPLVIKTSSRFAGAIYSLTWKGQEFINDHDHGRLLQSASSFDGVAECFNPTEAGSASDGTKATSTSRLLAITHTNDDLATSTQMAFWLAPGGSDGTHCLRAINTTAVSNHTLLKNVQIGFSGMPNVIEYRVAFHTPDDEHHTKAQFEALTGYMPAKFSQFWTYDGTTLTDLPASAGYTAAGVKKGGQQILPIITGTPDQSYAIGIYSPDLPQAGRDGGYGRAQFLSGNTISVVKWNFVFHYEGAQVSPGQDYGFRMYVVVGSVPQVEASMKTLMELPR
jgi:hypothetical protein